MTSFDNTFKISIVVLLISALGGIILTGFNSFYWLDDFWKINLMESMGYLETLKWFYLNWDGRAISPIYWMRNLLLFLVPYRFSTVNSFLSILTLFLTAGVIYQILSLYLPVELRKKRNVLVGLILVFLWLSFAPHLSRSVYWATGAFYNYANLGVLYFFYMISSKKKISKFNILYCFVMGLSGVNISLIMFVALILGERMKITSFSKRDFYKIILTTVISFLLVFIAPGNFKRGEGEFVFAVFPILSNYFQIIKEAFFMSKWVFISAILLALVLGYSENRRKYAKVSLLFFILAIVYIGPFAFFGSGAPKHTIITFHTLLWISVFFFGTSLTKPFESTLLLRKNLTLIGVLVYINVIIFQQVKMSRTIAVLVRERYSFLEYQRGEKGTVAVERIVVQDDNFTNRFWDLYLYPNETAEKYLEEFFEINEIVSE